MRTPIVDPWVAHEAPSEVGAVDLEAMRALAVRRKTHVVQQGRDRDDLRIERFGAPRTDLGREDPGARDVIEQDGRHARAGEIERLEDGRGLGKLGEALAQLPVRQSDDGGHG
ncbi:hypothetical protein QP162_07605 [Sphingomonas aurantiaca]|uniref:hypothetical protein n=1 Tax=Sphingomonas aurantiaca TaxID=185949 RepID=UPI002FE158FE